MQLPPPIPLRAGYAAHSYSPHTGFLPKQ